MVFAGLVPLGFIALSQRGFLQRRQLVGGVEHEIRPAGAGQERPCAGRKGGL